MYYVVFLEYKEIGNKKKINLGKMTNSQFTIEPNWAKYKNLNKKQQQKL